MDDTHGQGGPGAFAQPYPPYSFDIDMMKRSMDPSTGPDSKKARWSPTSGGAAPGSGVQSGAAPNAAQAGYGYNAGGFGGSPLYTSAPSLSINTNTTAPDMSSFQQQSQAQAQAQVQQQSQAAQSPVAGSPYAAFSPYSMLGMGFPYQQQQNFTNGQGQITPQRLPSLNIPAAQAVYANPGLAGLLSASAAGPQSATQPTPGRTVYIGNLPPSASVDELLNLVHFGPLESIRVLPEKSCVFLSFLDAPTAAAFFADGALRKLTLHNQELKIGWGKPSPVPAQVLQAIAQSGASRNVYLGGLDEGMTEEQLRDELSKFGLIDQVKIVRDKNIGFVHFLSIGIATKVVNTLPTDPAWAGKRVNYGKDRCAYVPKSQQAAAHQAQAAAAQSLLQQSFASPLLTNNPNSFSSPIATTGNSFANYSPSPASGHPSNTGASQQAAFTGSPTAAAQASAGGAAQSPNTPFTPYTPFTPDALSAMMGMGMFGMNMMSPMSPMGMNMGMAAGGGNRTVYLGNIHPETTTEDLCNAIRGGVLQSIRYMQDKHIAFITFIDPAAAFTFFQVSSYQGLTLNNRRLKIGWGKNAGPLPPTLALAVHAGATRNVYIGNIEDFEVFNEERLKQDFGEFGDIELVNFLKEKNCAFVNFTNISNAIKAIDAIKARPEYVNLRIAHGKDRCANPPRSGAQGGGGRRAPSGSHANGGPVSAVEAPEGGMDFELEAHKLEEEANAKEEA